MITPCRYTTQLPIHCIIHGKDREINHRDDDDDKNQQNSNKKRGILSKLLVTFPTTQNYCHSKCKETMRKLKKIFIWFILVVIGN